MFEDADDWDGQAGVGKMRIGRLNVGHAMRKVAVMFRAW
jgi:hypothetical protein